MKIIQISTYGNLLFAVTIKNSILEASPMVNRYFLPIFVHPQKITGVLGKAFPDA